MLERDTIQSAKEINVNIILDEFNWQMDTYGKIRCPHPNHNDSSPSCSFSATRNTFKCFGCGKVFDTIDLYQCLCEKIDGRNVPFYKAVEEILQLDGSAGGVATNQSATTPQNSNNVYTSPQSSNNVYTTPQSNNNVYTTPQSNNNTINSKSSPYDLIMSNSKPLSGYELNYLHSRGIFLYDSYVYNKQVYTAKNIEKALLTTKDQNEITRLNEIKSNGTFYKAIAPILHANRISIKHNYWQGTNSIIYHIDYDYDNDEALQTYSHYLETTEYRHMAIQKTLDNQHIKRALGTSDFIWIAEKLTDKDIYICEGLEDALSFTQNGLKSISLNSIANLKSLIQYLSDDYAPQHNERFIIAFDHDTGGQNATQELIAFFEDYNKQNPRRKYHYEVCNYPQQYHDINDYWVSRVFQ